MRTRPSPEQQVIIEAVRHALGCGAPPRTVGPIDWDMLLDLAFRQGLAPLVHDGLAPLGSSTPDAVRSRLRAAYLGAVVRTEIWVLPTLQRAIAGLAESGLEPIILKGAALAYRVYSDPAHRTLADVDLLLPTEHLGLAGEALTACGFHIDHSHPEATHHLRPYYADDGQVAVELHDRLLPEPHPYALDVEALRNRSEIQQVGGVGGRVLSLPDALLHGCFHLSYAHRYRWFPFRTLTDILAITTFADGLDWDRFLDTVHRSRMAGAVYWPLELCRAWLGAPIPVCVLSRLAPSTAIHRLIAGAVEPSYFLSNEVPPEPGRRALYSMLLNLSLYPGRSPWEQLASYLGNRRRVAVAVRAYLADPSLVAGMALALGRVIARRPT